MRGALAIAVAGALVVCAGTARADKIDVKADQLRSSSQYKVRLSAALWLSKQRDARAVEAMTYALRHDGERTVRAMAAVSLGKMIDETTPIPVRDAAIEALGHAADHDDAVDVRKKAAVSYDKLRPLRVSRAELPSVFIAVGFPTSKSKLLPRAGLKSVQQVVRRALRTRAPDYAQGTDAEGLPSKTELARAGSRGFYVNASVVDIAVVRRGGRADVSCTVTMMVNPWEGRDGKHSLRDGDAATATGRGKVIGTNSGSGIERASRDCVHAVVEEVVGRQVVPFIKARSDRRVAEETISDPPPRRRPRRR